jgi:hypothetical protein
VDIALSSQRDPLAALPIRVAIVVSVLVHAALLLELPPLQLSRPALFEPAETPKELTVRLAPPFASPPPSLAQPEPRPAPRARRRPMPPAAFEPPAPRSAPQPVPPAGVPAAPAPAGDLMAYVEARRRARGAPAEPPAEAAPARPAEDENARASRLAAANLNLGPSRMTAFGYDPTKNGGVFTLERMTFDYAEFTFIGWNHDIRRRTKQLIEVRKGGNSDIRIAVVRKIIAIIREHEPVEFDWYSDRLGRSISLSSRMRDNAGLEDFMMREFFGATRGG